MSLLCLLFCVDEWVAAWGGKLKVKVAALFVVCLGISLPAAAQKPDTEAPLLAKDRVVDYLAGKKMPFIPPPMQLKPRSLKVRIPMLPRTIIDAESPWPRERFKLDFTAVAGVQRRALISGHAVKPGDTLGGARVLAITHGQVRLEASFGEFTLKAR